MLDRAPPNALGRSLAPNLFDVAALALVIGALVTIAYGAHQTSAPLTVLDSTPISLDPWHLPEYALRTTLRMLAAIIASLVFTFIYATVAAKSRRAEMVLIPVLDVLQSVPILGLFDLYGRLFHESVSPAGCWARNWLRFSPFSPARPGT